MIYLAMGARNQGLCFFFPAFCLAADLGYGRGTGFFMPGVIVLHSLLCHINHLALVFRKNAGINQEKSVIFHGKDWEALVKAAKDNGARLPTGAGDLQPPQSDSGCRVHGQTHEKSTIV